MLKGLFYIFLGIMLACSCNSKSKKQNEQEVNTPTSVNDSNTIAKIEFPQKSFNFGDLQEGNLFLKQDGVLEEPGFCCLLDFGSARKLRESTQTVLLNPEDFVFSTPGYTPPELLNWDREE